MILEGNLQFLTYLIFNELQLLSENQEKISEIEISTLWYRI